MTDGERINEYVTGVVADRLAADLRAPYAPPEPVDWFVGYDPDAPLVRGGQGRADLDVPQALTIWTVLGWAFIAAVSFGAGYLLGMAGR